MGPDEATKELQQRYIGAQDLVRQLYSVASYGRIDVRQAHVIAGLLTCAISAQKHLRRGYEDKDNSYIAWATRNLLEITIWAEFCMKSSENARRFYLDSLRDLTGTMVAYKELIEVIAATDEQRALIEETRRGTAELSEELGVHAHDTNFLPISEAADLLEKGPWFRKTNKILSKLVHPTAFVVSTSMAGNELEDVGEHFFMVGFYHAIAIFDNIDSFAKSLQ